jgi:hypothetical protein
MEYVVGVPYLLDTSAFRSMGARKLAPLAQRQRLLVSPYCFWEILSHLHEKDKFAYIKSVLINFQYVSVLNDPQAATVADLCLLPSQLHIRVPDNEIIYAFLAALRDSNSLAEFYSKQIVDRHGNERPLSNCASRAYNVLETEEKRFVSFVRQIMGALAQGSSVWRTPVGLHRAALRLLNGWYITQFGRSLDENSDHRVLRRLYVYYCFVARYAQYYLEDPTRNIDGNDFEDARLCQHISLDRPCVIVAGDRTLRKLLADVLTRPECIGNQRLSHSLRVCSHEELV